MVQVAQAMMAPQVMMEAMKMEVHAQDLKGRATLEPSSQVSATTRNKFLMSTILYMGIPGSQTISRKGRQRGLIRFLDLSVCACAYTHTFTGVCF